MKLFFHWILASIAIAISAYLVPGVQITIPGTLIAAVVFGALNLFIRPLILILTLPINVLTLGIFTLVVNALLVMLVAYLVPGFHIAGFLTAFVFAIVLALVNWVFHYWSRAV